MGGIKETFKRGLKKAGTAVVNAAIDTPEHRYHKREVDFKVKDAERRGYEEGRIKGAYQKGYAKGKARSKQGSGGAFGMVKAGFQGLEDGLTAGASILGVEVKEPRRSQPQKRRRKRRTTRHQEPDTYIF